MWRIKAFLKWFYKKHEDGLNVLFAFSGLLLVIGLIIFLSFLIGYFALGGNKYNDYRIGEGFGILTASSMTILLVICLTYKIYEYCKKNKQSLKQHMELYKISNNIKEKSKKNQIDQDGKISLAEKTEDGKMSIA